MENRESYTRRHILKSLGGVAAATALGRASLAPAKENKVDIRLGFDNFSIRAMGWKAPQLLSYAASQKVGTVIFSDLDVYESYEDAYLKSIKSQADKLGIRVQAGTGSICPTSNSFNKKYGTVDELLALGLRVAKTLESPVFRCYLGNGGDRNGDGGIYRHMEEVVKVCKRNQSLAEDAGVKIAIENHAGDMQAWELAELIESAGRGYVGALMDSGNAVWTLDDPLRNLEILGPYAVSTGIRDSAVWEDEDGNLLVAWTDMGDGHVDWTAYMERYGELCPGVPFQLEIISGGAPRRFEYLKDEFWKAYPKARAADLAAFVAMAKRGSAYQTPEDRPKSDEQAQQRYDLERSLRYCRETLGLS